MKELQSIREIFVLLVLVIPVTLMAETGSDLFVYLSPVPGSSLVSPGNNIIVRYPDRFDPVTIRSDRLLVKGTRSGVHSGTIDFSTDGALLFKPDEPFSGGESVTVEWRDGGKTVYGEKIPDLEFSFTVSRSEQNRPGRYADEMMPGGRMTMDSRSQGEESVLLCDTLVQGYPDIDFLFVDNPDPGYLFLSPFPGVGVPGHMMILDNNAVPLFYRRMPAVAFDFRKQPGGLLTYYDFRDVRKYFVMDSSYNVIDSIESGNGYPMTDGHELKILENGNIILMIYDIQTVRMDTVVAGGDSAAQVAGLVLQEMDPARNVIFQWRSWDHFSIFDGEVSGYVALDSNWIDYVHGNSVEVDTDGNWIISSRHMNEITKIDRLTGDIIWRMGLNAANNDFVFINDTRGFSHQHDVRRLPNGNLTLFDNGNFLEPEYSRALEYELDEHNLTATLVWEYRSDPDVFGPFMGSVRRSGTGSTLVGWGGTTVPPSVTELHPDGTKALELNFVGNAFSYRAYRSDWRTNMFTTNVDSVDFGVVPPGDSSSQALNVINSRGTGVTITCLANADPAFIPLAALPITIPPHSSVGLTVKFSPSTDGDVVDYLYVRSVSDSTLVAQRVVLTGTTIPTSVGPESDLPLTFRLGQNYPNPFNPSTMISFSTPRSSRVNLTVFDILGRVVATIVDEELPPGSYSRQWDASGLTSGVYLYRLSTANSVQTRKLVLVR